MNAEYDRYIGLFDKYWNIYCDYDGDDDWENIAPSRGVFELHIYKTAFHFNWYTSRGWVWKKCMYRKTEL